MRAVTLALRELAQQTDFDDEARDLAAFIAIALRNIDDGIDTSVTAWEKRGYWVKADKFRMQWAWAGTLSARMQSALAVGDWPAVATVAIQIAEKLAGIQIGARTRLGRPWLGAFARLTGG